MSPNTISPDERYEVELMLPWYDQGLLDAAERRRVETALARDPVLQDRLALIREEREMAVEANELAGAPSPGALDRLMRSIEAESGPERARAGGPGWLSRLLGAPVPMGLQWAGAAAAVVIVLQAAALGYLSTTGLEQGARYETASGDAPVPAGGTFALVRFSESATAGQIAAYLSDMDMAIVDGPKPGGVYTVRIADKRLNEADRDALLKKMSSHQMLIDMAVAAEGVR